jgi:hypothetical protein
LTPPEALDPEPEPEPVPLALEPVLVAVAAEVDGVMVADARQPFWQFWKFKSSSAVPLPLGQLETHEMVLFC